LAGNIQARKRGFRDSSQKNAGKFQVPGEKLYKSVKLTDLEFGLIKPPARAGYNILKDIKFP
jgi:HD-GYP domain-containing protein (c-di-GMP phosphodiesterase class II)